MIKPGDICRYSGSNARVRIINIGPEWALVEGWPRRAGSVRWDVEVSRLSLVEP